METHNEHYNKAVSSFKMADHLFNTTFSTVNDYKLLIAVLDHLSHSLIHGMNAVLEFERMYKRIMPLTSNFESRFDVFKKIFEKYEFTDEEVNLIADLKMFLEERKDAPIEFTRTNKIIICSDNYKMKSVSLDDVKKYLSIADSFIMKVDKGLKNA